MNVLILIGLAAILSMFFVAIPKIDAQVPENCGWDQENRCVVASEEDAEDLIEDFPDAIVEVNEELLDSIPEEEQEDIDEMDEQDEEESDEGSEDSGDSQQQQQPTQENNFQPIPPGQGNLPPAEQSAAGLINACVNSGISQQKCNNMFISDDPGGYCSTLKIAGLPCPKIQDPAFTFGNPGAATEESKRQTENTQRAIEGFNQAVPDNLGRGFVIP